MLESLRFSFLTFVKVSPHKTARISRVLIEKKNSRKNNQIYFPSQYWSLNKWIPIFIQIPICCCISNVTLLLGHRHYTHFHNHTLKLTPKFAFKTNATTSVHILLDPLCGTHLQSLYTPHPNHTHTHTHLWKRNFENWKSCMATRNDKKFDQP